MTNGDVVSMVLAGVALLLGATISVLMLMSARRRARVTSSAVPPLAVRLVPSTGTDLGYWWRFEAAADAPPTEVNIFSFRCRSADLSIPWQHELMGATLMLTPAQPTYLRAPATVSTAYDVSVGWTIRWADADSQGSAILTVEQEPLS